MFAVDLIYDDVWYTNAVQENRQLLILNGLDLVSTIAPHVNIFLSIHTVTRLLVRAQSSITVGPTPLPIRAAPERSREEASHRTCMPRKGLQFFHLLSLTWAIGVISAHGSTR